MAQPVLSKRTIVTSTACSKNVDVATGGITEDTTPQRFYEELTMSKKVYRFHAFVRWLIYCHNRYYYSCIKRTGFFVLSRTLLAVLPSALMLEVILLLDITIKSYSLASDSITIASEGFPLLIL